MLLVRVAFRHAKALEKTDTRKEEAVNYTLYIYIYFNLSGIQPPTVLDRQQRQ